MANNFLIVSSLYAYCKSNFSMIVAQKLCTPRSNITSKDDYKQAGHHYYLGFTLKTLLYHIEWSIIWKMSYFSGLTCQRKCRCTCCTLFCITKYLESEIERRMFFKSGISFSFTKTANDSQFKTSKKGGTKLSDIITGTLIKNSLHHSRTIDFITLCT